MGWISNITQNNALDVEEDVSVIWWQWCFENSGFRVLSVGSQKMHKNKGRISGFSSCSTMGWIGNNNQHNTVEMAWH